jgi:hypothetical protein
VRRKRTGGQLLLDPIQAAVSQKFAIFVFHAMLMQKPEGWPQSAAVNELHDGKKLFQFVFQRSTCEHEGIRTLQLFDGAGGRGRPIPDALGFVENDQVRPHFVHVAQVLED